MPAKKNKPTVPAAESTQPAAEPTQPAAEPTKSTAQPLSLEDRAKALYDALGKGEQSAAETYWNLGYLLRVLQQENAIGGWNDLLAYANDELGMDNKSKVTRSLRIFAKNDTVKDVTGKSIKEACDYRCMDEPEPNKPDRTPQLVGSPLVGYEYQAAMRFEKAVGGKDRALEVVVRIYNNGEKPKDKGGKRPRLAPIVKIFATRMRGDVRKNIRGFVEDFAGKVQSAEEIYAQKRNEAIAVATTEEAKAKLIDVLRNLEQNRDKAYYDARDVLSKRQVANFDRDKFAFVADVQRMVNEALNIPPATPQPTSTPQSASAPVISAN